MTVAKAAETILGWGCEIVVITRSSKGASAFFNGSDQCLQEVFVDSIELEVLWY